MLGLRQAEDLGPITPVLCPVKKCIAELTTMPWKPTWPRSLINLSTLGVLDPQTHMSTSLLFLMTKLTPAAESVHNAFWFGHEYPDSLSNEDLAAALRAAANYDPPDNPDAVYDMGWYAAMEFIQSIAEELEAQ